MPITRADVEHAARLANLELTPQELAAMEKDLGAILDYVQQLGQLDSEPAEPMAQVLPAALHRPPRPLAAPASAAASGAGPAPDEEGGPDALRADEVRAGFTQSEALANAPVSGAGYFKVPSIIRPA